MNNGNGIRPGEPGGLEEELAELIRPVIAGASGGGSNSRMAVVLDGSADPLADLARLISQPPKLPEIGAAASEAMRKCYETVATDIERLAKEHVDQALELQQQAQTFAEIVRTSGELLCGKIEGEAIKAMQISQVMRAARDLHQPESGDRQ